MKVRYDKSLALVGLGIVPWARIGLERWFPKYRIISYYGWDLDGYVEHPAVHAIEDKVRIARKNMQHVVETATFREIISTQYRNHLFLPYKPVELNETDLAERFLMNGTRFTGLYENKAEFRLKFGDVLPFAPYKIYPEEYLVPTKTSYENVCHELGEVFVLQHESLSGGKGTYIIRTLKDYIRAFKTLPPEGRIIGSSFVAGKERTIQACATRFGTVTGPVQKQIIRDERLCNVRVAGGTTFNGGEIGATDIAPAAAESLRNYAKIVGESLYADGYRGIFGIDALVLEDQVYVLEVNARLTGMTPLLTAAYREDKDVPFYLLHALELGGFDYRITDDYVAPAAPAALLLLQNQRNKTERLVNTVRSGIYRWRDGTLEFIRPDCAFSDEDDKDSVLIQAYVPKGAVVKPGERLVAVFIRRPVLDPQDKLTTDVVSMVDTIYKSLAFEPQNTHTTAMPEITRPAADEVPLFTVGESVIVAFPEYGLDSIEAKVDTGAMSAALHTTKIREITDADGSTVLHFSPFDHPEVDISTRKYFKKRVRSSNGQDEERFFIRTSIMLEGRKFRITASLTDRSSMTYPMLLGSRFLKRHKILVDLSKVSP